jgi:Predicted ATP-dependent serine protease
MKKNKVKTIYVCNECGATYPTWVGRCSVCGAYNSVVEEIKQDTKQFSNHNQLLKHCHNKVKKRSRSKAIFNKI